VKDGDGPGGADGGTELASLLRVASDLAEEAGRATLRHFGRSVAAELKADGTPVTEADREAEELLRAGIRRDFPDDGIVGEEFGAENPDAPRRWILDPIDGTRSFTCGVPLYAVLVGLEWDGRAVLGVIHFPALGDTVAAARGRGCWLNGTRCRVSERSRLGDAVTLTTDPAEIARSRIAAGWTALTDAARYVRGWGDAYGHALVATGRADVMVDPELALWDAAPLLPILEEAGGRFTSLEGDATIHGASGVSTNGLLHDRVLEVLGARDPSPP
jgi:histidinol-phosphatase